MHKNYRRNIFFNEENEVKTIEDMIWKSKTEFIFPQTSNNSNNQMDFLRKSNTFRIEEDLFGENVQDIALIMHKALFSMKLLQTKTLSYRILNSNYFDL